MKYSQMLGALKLKKKSAVEAIYIFSTLWTENSFKRCENERGFVLILNNGTKCWNELTAKTEK